LRGRAGVCARLARRPQNVELGALARARSTFCDL
jgi:hypothetical protein